MDDGADKEEQGDKKVAAPAPTVAVTNGAQGAADTDTVTGAGVAGGTVFGRVEGGVEG